MSVDRVPSHGGNNGRRGLVPAVAVIEQPAGQPNGGIRYAVERLRPRVLDRGVGELFSIEELELRVRVRFVGGKTGSAQGRRS